MRDSEWEDALICWVKKGNKVVIYVSVKNSGSRLMDMLNLSRTEPVEGILDLELNLDTDALNETVWPKKVLHRELMSEGGIDTVVNDKNDAAVKVLAAVCKESSKRDVAVYRSCPEWNGGAVVWLRGTNSNGYYKGSFLLIPDDAIIYFPMESLMRLALSEFGYDIRYYKEGPNIKNPVTMIHRSNGAFFFSGYVPDTTVKMKFRMPLGAPILIGNETKLDNGHSVYHMPRAWHAECRVFVEQEENSILTCREICPVSYEMRRRIQIRGLMNATVRIFPQKGYEEKTEVLLNSTYPYFVGQKLDWGLKDTPWGKVIETKDVTGQLTVSTNYL
ncbi:MAG: hypothetical protein A2Y21_09680 [Clostridiales bacterium GWC2_40_7]|nr:MAG: hypothetical protein A2Y21_09680 [Clostridiales bacterium GWC2_40_7]